LTDLITGGKEKDDGEVEMEAYGQGALKTELCNKWEHSVCPYDGRCRFAHGMEELCPVICHPRCKTLACQLFASGYIRCCENLQEIKTEEIFYENLD